MALKREAYKAPGALDKLTEHFWEAYNAGFHDHVQHGNIDVDIRRESFNNWMRDKFVELMTK